MSTQKQNIIYHIDMNSYFASVEQQANPFLRGKSVGVCAYNSPNGVIIASSVEAKKKGIKTGCKVREAKVLDPEVVIAENEPAKYRTVTGQIFKILEDYTDKVEPYSIDEAFLDMTGYVPSLELSLEISLEIQSRIKKEVGEWLGSSIGVSWTRFLAKFASDLAPKQSVLTIDNEDKLNSLLRGRDPQEAWGVGPQMAAKLKAMGIRDLCELKIYSPQKLKFYLGWYGYYLWAGLNGMEINNIKRGVPKAKNIGHSYCIPKKTQDKDYLRQVLFKLCEKTGRRLRAQNLEAQNIHMYLAYTRGGVGKGFKTPEKMFTTDDIFDYADNFLSKAELVMPVRMVAVSVGRLAPVTAQMNLFNDNLKKKDLSLALDKINDKYGEYTVSPGLMFGSDNIAKDRIGFRKID